jgi:hypothetical protein
LTNADSFDFFIEGRKASPIMDEKGDLDTEGFGRLPEHWREPWLSPSVG